MKKWLSDLKELGQLQELRMLLNAEVSRRALSKGKTKNLGGIDENGHYDIDDRKLLRCVRDLIDLESELLEKSETLAFAEASLAKNPDLLNNRIILHIQVYIIYFKL